MSREPNPLNAGWRLADRFEIVRVLGRGGFGIAYVANDERTGDQVVVKELAPQGTLRTADGVLRMDDQTGPRLRERFLEEAGVISRFNVAGVAPIRAIFRENGTAYFATELVPNAITLSEFLKRNGRLSANEAFEVFEALLKVLSKVHEKRVLHRDIKPSNILIDDEHSVYLIDFGAAREWHADTSISQTVFFTPGYAPPEQLSNRAKRGPATDIYATCATIYEALVGSPPPSATDRAAGVPVPPLASMRPDLEPSFARAIESGMELRYSDRPQTIHDLRELLDEQTTPDKADTLSTLDQTLLRLKNFKFDRRACPSCKQLLTEPRPLRKNVCPVCRSGTLKKRDIHDRRCPICRLGVLGKITNGPKLAICPSCKRGILTYKRKSVVSPEQIASCGSCDARFDVRGDRMSPMTGGPNVPYDFAYWRKLSGRADVVWLCGDCQAQFDVLADGRWLQVNPTPKADHRVLFPDEWARVAIGLDPGVGNAECVTCGADFYLDASSLTLLDTPEDPYGFAQSYLGRLVKAEDARWLAVGKTSGKPGLTCETCHTEFDRDYPYLRLVATTNRKLRPFIDQPKTIEDWHRVVLSLPTIDKEAEFMAQIEDTLRNEYRTGGISFDNEGTLLWKGDASLLEEGSSAMLVVTSKEIVFGGLLRKKRRPTDSIVSAWADERELHIRFGGERVDEAYGVAAIQLTAHLASGEQTLLLDARDLAARLTAQFRL